MANKNRGLNKGLDAIFGGDVTSLIEEIENNPNQKAQIEVDLDEIRPNPHQPRKVFDQEKLNELASSIKEHGIFQPIILKQSISGYEIVAGERRCRAAKLAGLTKVPAILVDFSDDQMMEIALLENIQREDLNAIEEAKAYQNMMARFSLTQESLAKKVGKSRTHITNILRLLNLSTKVQNAVLENKISMGHARALISLDDVDANTLVERIIKNNLSVRDVENIVKGLQLRSNKKNKEKQPKSTEYKYVEDLLKNKFRTKVSVDEKTIVLKYTNTNDLNRILELMGVIEE